MPLKYMSSVNFSLGACIWSSGRPRPTRTAGNPMQSGEQLHRRDRATLAGECGPDAEDVRHRARGGEHGGVVDRRDHRTAARLRVGGDRHPGGRGREDRVAHQAGDPLRVLVRDQPAGDLGAGARRNDRLAARTRVPAPDPVELERGTCPEALANRPSSLADGRGHPACLGTELGVVVRSTREQLALRHRGLVHVVVEAGHGHPPRGRVMERREDLARAPRSGFATAPPNRPECRSRDGPSTWTSTPARPRSPVQSDGMLRPTIGVSDTTRTSARSRSCSRSHQLLEVDRPGLPPHPRRSA